MARTLATELMPRGIRVNAVSPGPNDTAILTKSTAKHQADDAMVMMAENTPMKRLGRCEEIAKAVAVLAFEATYTTGAALPVDGGMSQP
jgi:NAD(P)-dependent dehydrogenase (short-subunit alcohol dehydrogenase family)